MLSHQIVAVTVAWHGYWLASRDRPDLRHADDLRRDRVSGVVRAFLTPACMSLFAPLLKRGKFAHSGGISSVVMQAGLLLGPALGGVLAAWGGVGRQHLCWRWCRR